jgi:enolase
MSKIVDITGREILNSRGVPTVSASVHTRSGAVGECAVPSGASTGSSEAQELRDGAGRFGGQGVRSSVKKVEGVLADELHGFEVKQQSKIDKAMTALDGTENKSRLGANTILAVSVASAKAAAKEQGKTLAQYIAKTWKETAIHNRYPKILANLINGGAHTISDMPIQEFLVIAQTSNPKDTAAEIYDIRERLQELIKKELTTSSFGVGDEGGFVIRNAKPERLLRILSRSIQNHNFTLGIDVAASEFYDGESYHFDGASLSANDLRRQLVKYANTYPLEYIEDPFNETDFQTHARFNREVAASVVGDDLTVTSKDKINDAAETGSVSSVIIKPNQIGTLTETATAVMEARKHDLHCYASHRSGETNDSFIVDFAVGLGCYGIKIGGMQRGERISKYNRLAYLYDNQ